MNYHLVIKPDAETDIRETYEWYESQHEGLGKRFIEAVGRKLVLIEKQPLIYQLRYKKIRFVLIKIISICNPF